MVFRCPTILAGEGIRWPVEGKVRAAKNCGELDMKVATTDRLFVRLVTGEVEDGSNRTKAAAVISEEQTEQPAVANSQLALRWNNRFDAAKFWY